MTSESQLPDNAELYEPDRGPYLPRQVHVIVPSYSCFEFQHKTMCGRKVSKQHWMRSTDSVPSCKRCIAALRNQEWRGCPDGGTCWHRCKDKCWRVGSCAPLSDYGDVWPDDVKAAHT